MRFLRLLSNLFVQIALYLLALLSGCGAIFCTLMIRFFTTFDYAYYKGHGIVGDEYADAALLDRCYQNRTLLLIGLVLGSLLLILFTAFLLYGVGRDRQGSPRTTVSFVFPLDLSCLLGVFAAVVLIRNLSGLLDVFYCLYEDIFELNDTISQMIVGVGCLAIFLFLLAQLAAQLRRRVLPDRLLFVRAGKRLAAVLPLYWKQVLILLAFILIHSALLYFGLTRRSLVLLLSAAVFDLAVLVLFLRLGGKLDRLLQAGRILASGDFSYTIRTDDLWGEARRHGEALNSIGEGMARAVDARMKNERFRAELITNVSHDLKTPLTSIVNFTDLLSREELPEGKAREYVEVLQRQAARLKKLTEDLIEASKAASGVIPVVLDTVHVEELVQQAVAEYESRLCKAQLEPVLRLDGQNNIQADGRLLWRVFDNLLSNICKYALTGTRVYIETAKSDGMICIRFKNISAQMLNIDPQELTERFVRGEASRHSEGSGLGLSIAQSLTALQGGSFTLSIDGDLFTASVEFPLSQS